jgi:hypothetical protein
VAEFVQTMLERSQQKSDERRQFTHAVRTVADHCEGAAKAALRDFEAAKKTVLREVATTDPTPEEEQRVRALLEQATLLQDRLMELEIQQVEQTEVRRQRDGG